MSQLVISLLISACLLAPSSAADPACVTDGGKHGDDPSVCAATDIMLQVNTNHSSVAKKKRHKQKKWAAKMTTMMEVEVCQKTDRYPEEWEECADWELTVPNGNFPKSCQTECDGEISFKDYNCGQFCAQSWQDCLKKWGTIAVAFVEVMANFIPGGKALTAVREAVGKAAIQAAIKKAAKKVAEQLKTKAKKNLKGYMKQLTGEWSEEAEDALKEDILDGGFEHITAVFVAKHGADSQDLVEAAGEMVAAVDPTGISDLIEAFSAPSCDNFWLEDMPALYGSEWY